MNIKPTQRRKQRGFSLVELLVTIAVIGVLAGISLAAMSGVNGAANKTTAQTQAQRIAAVFNSGLAAGSATFTASNSVDQAMNAVGIGSNGGGNMSTSHFRLPGITSTMDDGKPAEDQAKTYLSWNGTLIYNAAGDGGGGGSSGGGTEGGSGPPSGYSALSGSAVSQIMQAAALFTNNPTISLQGAADWYNATTGTAGALIVHEGQLYSRTSSGESSGGSSGDLNQI